MSTAAAAVSRNVQAAKRTADVAQLLDRAERKHFYGTVEIGLKDGLPTTARLVQTVPIEELNTLLK